MFKFINYILLFSFFFLLTNCGETDERIARSSSPKRQEIYDFMNDVRLEIAEFEQHYTRLNDFVEETKTFLQSRDAQSYYKISGLYFEKNLNREKGAYNYEDRFFDNGMMIHVIIYPPSQKGVWQAVLGIDKGKGKQVGRNFIYYQVFTAQPTDETLENKINEIIERNIEKYAAQIGEFEL